MAGMKTISEQVYQTIYDGIISGQIKGGEKLTLKSIQDRLGVSSSPIREALTRLSEDGLIIYQPNIGMTVVDLTRKDAEDILSLAEEFDVIALKYAWNSSNRTEMILQLTHNQKKAALALEEGDRKSWIKLSDEFHNILLRYSGNNRLMEAAEKNRKQISILSSKYQQTDENAEEINDEHNEILFALESGEIKLAEKCMRAHLRSSMNKALALFQDKESK